MRWRPPPRCCRPSGCSPTRSGWLPAEPHALVDLPPVDAILVDARRDLAHARSMCRIVRTTELAVPVLAIVTEGGLTAFRHDWGVDDVLLDTAGPAEVDARLRLAAERLAATNDDSRRPGRDRGRRPRHRRRQLHGSGPRSRAAPHLPRVRAAEVSRAAQRAGAHPSPAAPRGLGLRLLRRHPNRRRPRPAAPGQARAGARVHDRHSPQRRLPVRGPTGAVPHARSKPARRGDGARACRPSRSPKRR